MRKTICIFIVILMTGMILTGAGTAKAESSSPRVILYTYYWLIGEGDDLQVGFIDEDGVIRTLTGVFSEMEWPYTGKEQLEYLSHTEKFRIEKTLSSDELFTIKSLIADTGSQEARAIGIAEDAGNEESYAVRYSKDGEPQLILLGVSGESVYENTDPNAQALYLLLRHLFPGVISYAYDPDGMGPVGFVPVSLAAFTGLDPEAVTNAEIKAVYNDCEAGPIPLELTDEEKTELLSLIFNGSVTGKADALTSTGDTYTYSFFGPEDELIGMIDFEGDLLVMNDGHYYIENQ